MGHSLSLCIFGLSRVIVLFASHPLLSFLFSFSLSPLILLSRIRVFSSFHIETVFHEIGQDPQLRSSPFFTPDSSDSSPPDTSLQLDSSLPLSYFDDGLDSFVEETPARLLQYRGEENESTGNIDVSASPYQHIRFDAGKEGWGVEGAHILSVRVRGFALYSQEENGPLHKSDVRGETSERGVEVDTTFSSANDFSVPAAEVSVRSRDRKEANIVTGRRWLPCTVVGCVGEGGDARYLVHWDHILDSQPVKGLEVVVDARRPNPVNQPWTGLVHRLNLLLAGEDPYAFARRVVRAMQYRAFVMGQLQLSLAADSMPGDLRGLEYEEEGGMEGGEEKRRHNPSIVRILSKAGRLAMKGGRGSICKAEAGNKRRTRRGSISTDVQSELNLLHLNFSSAVTVAPSKVEACGKQQLRLCDFSPEAIAEVEDVYARGSNILLALSYLKTIRCITRARPLSRIMARPEVSRANLEMERVRGYLVAERQRLIREEMKKRRVQIAENERKAKRDRRRLALRARIFGEGESSQTATPVLQHSTHQRKGEVEESREEGRSTIGGVSEAGEEAEQYEVEGDGQSEEGAEEDIVVDDAGLAELQLQLQLAPKPTPAPLIPLLDKALLQMSYLHNVPTSPIDYTPPTEARVRQTRLRDEVIQAVSKRATGWDTLPPTFLIALGEMQSKTSAWSLINSGSTSTSSPKRAQFPRSDSLRLKFLVGKKRLVDRFLHTTKDMSEKLLHFRSLCNDMSQLPLFDLPGWTGNVGGLPGGHGGTGEPFTSAEMYLEGQKACSENVIVAVNKIWQELSGMVRSMMASAEKKGKNKYPHTARPHPPAEKAADEQTGGGSLSARHEGEDTSKSARPARVRRAGLMKAVQAHSKVQGGYDSHDDLHEDSRIAPLTTRLFHLGRFMLQSAMIDLVEKAVREYVSAFEAAAKEGEVTGSIFRIPVRIEQGSMKYGSELDECLDAAVASLKRSIEKMASTRVSGRTLGSNSADVGKADEKVISTHLPFYSSLIKRLEAVVESTKKNLHLKLRGKNSSWKLNPSLLPLFEVEMKSTAGRPSRGGLARGGANQGGLKHRRATIIDTSNLGDAAPPAVAGLPADVSRQKMAIFYLCGPVPEMSVGEPSLPISTESKAEFVRVAEKITLAVRRARMALSLLEEEGMESNLMLVQAEGFVSVHFSPLLSTLKDTFTSIREGCEQMLTSHLEKYAQYVSDSFFLTEANLIAKPKACSDVTAIRAHMDSVVRDLPQYEEMVAALRKGYSYLDDLCFFPTERELNMMWTCVGWPYRLRMALERTQNQLEKERSKLAKDLYTKQQILFADVQTIHSSVTELMQCGRVVECKKRERELRHVMHRLRALRSLTTSFTSDQAHLGESPTDYSFVDSAEALSVPLSLLWSMGTTWLSKKVEWLRDPFEAGEAEERSASVSANNSMVMSEKSDVNEGKAEEGRGGGQLVEAESVMKEESAAEDLREQSSSTSLVDAEKDLTSSMRVKLQVEGWGAEVDRLLSTLEEVREIFTRVHGGQVAEVHLGRFHSRFTPDFMPALDLLVPESQCHVLLPFLSDFIDDVKYIKRHIPLITFIKTMKSRSSHWAMLATAIKQGKTVTEMLVKGGEDGGGADGKKRDGGGVAQSQPKPLTPEQEVEEASNKLNQLKKQLDAAVNEVLSITSTAKAKKIVLVEKEKSLAELNARLASMSDEWTSLLDASKQAEEMIKAAEDRREQQRAKTAVVEGGMAKASEAVAEVQKWTEGLVKDVPPKDFIELSSLVHPPQAIAYLLEAVLILCRVEPKVNADVFPHEADYWVVAQHMLKDPKRIQRRMKEVFVDGVVPKQQMKEVELYLALPEFNLESMLKASKATEYLVRWLMAVRRHFDITETVIPPQGDELNMSKGRLHQKEEEVEMEKRRFEDTLTAMQKFKQRREEVIGEIKDAEKAVQLCNIALYEEESLLRNLGIGREKLETMMKELKAAYEGIVASKAVRTWKRKGK
uniref:Dynein heavy chain coiled coil stalk domain-containing protein n=1 Tax=Palpitomonas bilix TaxID=652834 RepID=A0A7S3FYP3_9EUKA|mmetsp:Transcript_11276/g.29792  ORF Transcript_11276/g.29792 Transcript_11276/m.29792 type:complete len:1978 (+) Transcript_11276:603-6536(+)